MQRLIVPAFLALAAIAGAVLAQAGSPATIVVRVPADAVVIVGSTTTTQRGTERRFTTPDLVPGFTYTYSVEARWTEGGKEVKDVRTASFTSGQTATLDFLKKEVIGAPKKLPKGETKVEPIEPKVEVKPPVKPAPKVDPKVDPKVEVKPPVKPAPKVDPKVEVKPETKAEPKTTATEPGFTALFNGKDLSGWKVYVGGKDDEKTFTVKDGVVVVRGNPAGYFYTDKSYKNYTLRFDWKFIKDGNSGTLVHIVGEHKTWPKSIEVQGMQSEHGHIFAIGGAKGKFKTERDNFKKAIKTGEWNTTEIVSKDGELSASVNGVPISSGKGDLTEGPFGFQSEGTELHFKNIRIKVDGAAPGAGPAKVGTAPKEVAPKETAPPKVVAPKVPTPKAVAPKAPAPNATDAKEDAPKKVDPKPAAPKEAKVIAPPAKNTDDGFKSLFNGTNLDGWKTHLADPKADPAKTFVVANGEVQLPGFPNGYFYTDKGYKNYVLRFDWTYPKDQPEKTTMNSGLLVHIQEPHKIWPLSVEPQGRYKDHGKLFYPGFPKDHKNVQKFDEAALQKALKASHEWNTTEVTCKADGTVLVKVNGVPITEGKTHLTEGPIGFQSEAARIHFRNIKIKPLD